MANNNQPEITCFAGDDDVQRKGWDTVREREEETLSLVAPMIALGLALLFVLIWTLRKYITKQFRAIQLTEERRLRRRFLEEESKLHLEASKQTNQSALMISHLSTKKSQ
ncbi:hypothetical protein M3Y95_00814900 [Aphelenchoides besseyi]|nr:hypothetical protein M3Y95_00814900 [Aphelenchoides besseyi]